jgi:hypothetical protein
MDFHQQLHDQFGGRFRVRWSDKQQEYHLEQKAERGRVDLPPSTDEFGRWDTYDDLYIRARDGYHLIMRIRNGDRMPCPICGLEVKVPVMETRETHCERCRVQGRDGRIAAAFFPLGDRLLEHLRYIDPMSNGPQRAHQRVRAHQLATNERRRKEALDEAEHQVMFNRLQVENTPMSGYGQKTAQRGVDRLKGAEF